MDNAAGGCAVVARVQRRNVGNGNLRQQRSLNPSSHKHSSTAQHRKRIYKTQSQKGLHKAIVPQTVGKSKLKHAIKTEWWKTTEVRKWIQAGSLHPIAGQENTKRKWLEKHVNKSERGY
jgi:hypothetical protein